MKMFAIEIGLLVLAGLVLTIDLCANKRKFHWILFTSIGGLAAILGHLIFHRDDLVGLALNDCYSVTPLDLFFKGILILGSLFVLLIFSSRETTSDEFSGEPYLLILLGLVGASFAASSGELITLFISLEILTFASYILTAYLKKDKVSSEAGLKYLILGSLSSGFFLFGTAILYGATGSTNLLVIQQALTSSAASPALWTGFLIVFAGLAFKMGVSPFNFWIPDVYEGAPTWVGGFLSVVSKTTGFVAFSKLLMPFGEALNPPLLGLIAILSAATVLYGNLGACFQNNLKRLLGYSSIAQAGYLLLALTNPKSFGLKTVAFYLLVYTFSNLLVFLVVFLADNGKGERKSLVGLSSRSPLLTGCLFISLASLAGIPPTAGFVGKFFLFLSAFQVKAYLAIAIALIGVLISIFYYYRVVRIAFVKSHEEEQAAPIQLSPLAYTTLVVLAVSVLVFGVYPAPILNYLF